MQLQEAPYPWACLPTAFAIATGVPVTDLIEATGHDGSEIRWPNQREPSCRRAWHVQEIIRVLYRVGWNITPLERSPRSAPAGSSAIFQIHNPDIVRDAVYYARGVLTGSISVPGRRVGHAVAFDHGMICDPRGKVCHFSEFDFIPTCAWVVHRT